MAVTNDQITAFLAANAGMDDAGIAAAMNQYGVSTAQMAQATGLGQDAVQSRYDAVFAPPPAPLYQSLTAASDPTQIAQAYSQFTSGAGGDTAANQQEALTFLQGLGIAQPTIDQAYDQFSQPAIAQPVVAQPVAAQPFQAEEIDPYVYAYEFGVANNDFAALKRLLEQTPDSTALVSQYNLTPEQINEIEFGTGFDLDQSGGYGAGKVGNDWNYSEYENKIRAGDADSLSNVFDTYATLNPLAAKGARNMYEELLAQQEVTGDSWATGELGSKEAAAVDFALRLSENGVNSIYDLGQRNIVADYGYDDGGNRDLQEVTEYFNKKTGEALPDWDRVARSGPFELRYKLNFAKDGTPIPTTSKDPSWWVETGRPFAKMAVSFAAMANPALMPYVAAGNAINAADKGEWGTAIVSALTATLGFNELNPSTFGFTPATVETLNKAKTGAQVLNAVEKGNPIEIVNALMQTETGKDLFKMDMGGGVNLGNVLNTARIASLVNAGDYASALNYAGSLIDNPNLQVAGSSVALLNAIKSGDPFKVISAMGQLDRAVKTATKDSDNVAKRLTDAGLDEGDLPTGIQTASADGETPFRLEVAGAPIFADSPNAGSVRPPPGYRLMATTEEQEIQDGDRTRFVKPAGSYYDPTANAWFAPSDEFKSATDVIDYSALFGEDRATLTDADIAAIRGTDLATSPTDFGLDFESNYARPSRPSTDLGGMNITAPRDGTTDLGEMLITAPRDPIADMGEMVITAPREPITDMGEMVITAPRETVTDMGEMVITAPRDTTTDLGEMVITAPREEYEYPEMVITAPREPSPPATPEEPTAPSEAEEAETPAKVTPPKVTPPKVTPPRMTPAQVARILNVPVSSPIVQDVIEALYGTMEYLDIGAEFETSKRKARPAATQKQREQTKMAQGGYIDDLLAENMSVDELLNLLR